MAFLLFVLVAFILSAVFLFGLSAYLVKRRLWYGAAGVAAVALLFTFGPWAVSSVSVSQLEKRMTEASFWPEDLELRGKDIFFVHYKDDGCGALCGRLRRDLHGSDARLFNAPGRAADVVPKLTRHMQGEPAPRIRDMIGARDIAFDTFSERVDLTIVSLRSDSLRTPLDGPLSLPASLDGKTVWVTYVFEGDALWRGGAPVARMVSTKTLARGFLPFSSRFVLLPRGCRDYAAAWDAWFGGEGLRWSKGRGVCEQMFY